MQTSNSSGQFSYGVGSQVINVLLRTGRISEDKVSSILLQKQISNEPAEQILIKAGILKSGEIETILEKYFNAPYINLEQLKVEADILKIIPEEVMRKYFVVPFEKNENEIKLAMSFPNNLVALDDIQIITGYSIKPFVALESSIESFIDKYFAADEMDKAIKEAVFDRISLTNIENELSSGDSNETATKAPIVKLVDTLLTEAVRLGASDIHLEPQEKGIFVRYRINGLLRTKELLPKGIQLAVASRIKVMSGMDITEKRLPQDGQINMHINKHDIDFRVSTLPAKYGEKIVIRVLDKTNFAFGIEHLGFMSDTQTKFEELLNSGSGIVLVTGPTGSGKTTTLYSALNRIRSSTKNIITLEDPIEYDLLAGKTKESGITQVQINARIGLTFASSLRACLRQDPNIILVGEIRDEETSRISINASLMGHLVLSTIHTNDSVSTITRLLDMGIEPYLIASSLTGILAQRLVRTLCNQCRQPYHPPKKFIDDLKLKPNLVSAEEITLYRAKGCSHCDYSGYVGRLGIFELLVINESIRDLILEKAKLSLLKDTAIKNGMTTMKQNGIELVGKGITTMAEVLRVLPTS